MTTCYDLMNLHSKVCLNYFILFFFAFSLYKLQMPRSLITSQTKFIFSCFFISLTFFYYFLSICIFVLLGTIILHLILWIHEQNNSCLYIFIVLYTLRFLIRPCWTLSLNYLLTKNELSTFAQPRKNLQAFNHRGSQFLVSPMNLISHPLN